MVISFSNLVDNLAEWIYEIRCKYVHDKKKKWETSRIKCKKCECCLKYTNVKEDLVEWFDENLQKRFVVTYKFFNHDLNIFILLPWKGLYPYKCMGDW